MNTSDSDLIKLAPDYLQGIDGHFAYKEFNREFSGHFNAAGEPLFEWALVRAIAPVVRPVPGQVFEGIWAPHERMPMFVIDAIGIKLGFNSTAPLHLALPSAPILQRCLLSIECKEVKQGLAWSVVLMQTDDSGIRLNPEEVVTVVKPPSNVPYLRVSKEKALAFINQEMGIIREQRRAINCNEDPEVPAESAVLAARDEILGGKYRDALRAEMGVLGILPPESRSAGELLNPSIRRQFFDRMKEASQHPAIIQAIVERAQWHAERDRAFAYRLKNLEGFRANLIGQSSNLRQSTKPDLAACQSMEGLPNNRLEITQANPGPAKYATKSKQSPANRPRFKM